MILVIIFLAVSKSVIGLVLPRKQFQSCGLGIGYIVASFHCEGILEVVKQVLTSFLRYDEAFSGRCLISS